MACIHGNEVEESTEETARAGASDEHFPQSVKATLPVSLYLRTKPPTSPAASESEDARRDDENCSLSLEDQEDFYVDYKTNTIVQEVEEDKEEEEEEANNADIPLHRSTAHEDEDAKTDVPAPREPDAVHRSKVRRVSSPLDHLEDFYNEYKACKNFDLARGERGGGDSKAAAASTRAMPTTISNRTVGES